MPTKAQVPCVRSIEIDASSSWGRAPFSSAKVEGDNLASSRGSVSVSTQRVMLSSSSSPSPSPSSWLTSAAYSLSSLLRKARGPALGLSSGSSSKDLGSRQSFSGSYSTLGHSASASASFAKTEVGDRRRMQRRTRTLRTDPPAVLRRSLRIPCSRGSEAPSPVDSLIKS